EDQKPTENSSSPQTTSTTRKRWPGYWKLLSPGHTLILTALILGLVIALMLLRRNPQFITRDNFKPEVVIIQLNDTYRIDALENGNVGGLGRVATLIKQTQEQSENVFLVHAGDFIAPSLESTVFHGNQMIDALNYLNRLARLYVVPGNHEFDE